MPVLGITGGIATGKSTLTQSLSRRLNAEVFDADLFVRSAVESDPAIGCAIATAFGGDIFPDGGPLNRARLRELIFADPAQRRRLEAIVHPAVRARWLGLAELGRAAGRWLIIDIPLLYETEAEVHLDRVIVVGCSPRTQRRRLLTERALPAELAEQIIAAQLDLPTKIKRADHLIWNDSSTACLDAQTNLLSAWLTRHYG